MKYNPDLIYRGNFVEAGGYAAAKLMISKGYVPRAIFAANDEMAIGAINAFGESGVKVGEDVAIIGFDDIRIARYVVPPLTTMRQPTYEIGCLAVNLVLRALAGDFPESKIMLPAELIIRRSCGE